MRRSRQIADIVSETSFFGRMDSFPMTPDARGVPVMQGPSGSFGELIRDELGLLCRYTAPAPMRMATHWHSCIETIVGLSGELVMTVIGRHETVVTTIGAGDELLIPRHTPHRASVEQAASFLVRFSDESIFSVQAASAAWPGVQAGPAAGDGVQANGPQP